MEMHELSAVPAQPAAADTVLPEAAGAEQSAGRAVEESESVKEVAENAENAAVEKAPMTMETLLASAAALAEKQPADISGEELRRLRQQFNSLQSRERTEAKEGAEGDVKPADAEVNAEDAPEVVEFKRLLSEIRTKKAEYAAELEKLRELNLQRKQAIVDEINALAEDTDNVNRTFPRYRELQEQFSAIGEVPATDETAIWKAYQVARERYSDNLKINKELRDYDFRKNLEIKQELLSEAIKLTEAEDVIGAYRRLQELHAEWREVGPVEKELREQIWEQFKAASAEVNKRYQAHFEERKAREAEIEAAKTALCEEAEGIDLESIRSYTGWEEATKKILELQARWKEQGAASRKLNNALFARFREACDRFFTEKAAYFRNTRDEFARNLAAKTALAERAEELKDSTDWRKTATELQELQEQWKNIGAVAKKHSDAIWQRFRAACDYFFEQKKQATSGVRSAEQANLKAKRELIAELEAVPADAKREDIISLMRSVQDRWKEIGHVPFKEKDKIYDRLRSKLNELRGTLDMRENTRRMQKFEDNVANIEGNQNALFREREKLVRAAEAKRAEIRTYENNLGFLSSKSKSGESMLRDFERRSERLKSELATLEEQIKLLDAKL